MKLPVLFVGHGSPMNAIEDNEFTNKWTELGKSLPRPKAILSVSAHWYTASTRTSDTRTYSWLRQSDGRRTARLWQ